MKQKTSFSFLTILLVTILTSPAQANTKTSSITGEIINGTTHQPAKECEVRLIELKDGMKIIQTKKVDNGTYHFERVEREENIPYLIQVNFQGVNYNTPLPSHALSENLRSTVYETTSSSENITLDKVYWIIAKEKNIFKIQKIFILKNNSENPHTFTEPKETFRFFLPAEAKESVHVSVSTGMMPIPQTIKPIANSSFFSIQHPIKPGETEITVRYELKSQNPSMLLTEILPYSVALLNLGLYPTDMILDSNSFKKIDSNEKAGLALYQGGPFQKDETITLALSGGAEPIEPQIIGIPNKTQSLLLPLSSGILLILIFGSWVAFLKPKSNQNIDQKENLLKALLHLNEYFQKGKISSKEYQTQKDVIKSQLAYFFKK